MAITNSRDMEITSVGDLVKAKCGQLVMINILSTVMPKLAVIIPLVLLVYFCYAIYQNNNIASQDRKIYSEGIEQKG
ncbi:hypothetical protein [Serratia rhizosphaerae]|uniref:Uncharacterized protein n=1 Tax=Serratia rhizosphaerae TaxID=2597702 RepID=A0ABX6GM15_9GAMM|nr:hypothetical protein [Serratia rhizosphaerae]QHA87326.1 hypothetical protein FO014_10420 [Serratia rhizosphaerae]